MAQQCRWMQKISYARYRFPPVIIQRAVWLYFRFPLSYRDGFVTLTGFTPNLGKLAMGSLRNVSVLASWRQAENSLKSLNVTMSPPVPLLAEPLDAGRHPVRQLLRDRAVEHDAVLHPATQKREQRKVRRLAEDVPAGDVQGRLDMRMTEQRAVHDAVDPVKVAWVLSDEVGDEFRYARPYPGGVGRQVGGPQGAAFGVSRNPGFCLDLDHRVVENLDEPTVGPGVAPLGQRELDAPCTNGLDLHRHLPCLTLCNCLTGVVQV